MESKGLRMNVDKIKVIVSGVRCVVMVSGEWTLDLCCVQEWCWEKLNHMISKCIKGVVVCMADYST